MLLQTSRRRAPGPGGDQLRSSRRRYDGVSIRSAPCDVMPRALVRAGGERASEVFVRARVAASFGGVRGAQSCRIGEASMRSSKTARIGALLVVSLLVGCGDSEETPSPSPDGPVSLADSLATMEPSAVWQHFYDLTQVPRPSHHEEKATALVADFGRRFGLETIVDTAGNVLIRKPATTGMEGRPGVVSSRTSTWYRSRTTPRSTSRPTRSMLRRRRLGLCRRHHARQQGDRSRSRPVQPG